MFRSSIPQRGRLSRQQRETLKQFMKVTGVSEKEAAATLGAADWDLQGALLAFRLPPAGAAAAAAGAGAAPDSRRDGPSEAFLRYKDPDSDKILADGITLLCQDLQVEPEDICLLVFSWRCNASAICEFTREEFVAGFRSLRISSVEQLREALPSLRAEVDHEAKCREIYNFAFNWAKDKGQKWLGLESAVSLWQLILGYRKWALLDPWCDFVMERHKKAISRDTWTQLFEFTRVPVASLPQYDEEGAWPCLIDDFVAFLREREAAPCQLA